MTDSEEDKRQTANDLANSEASRESVPATSKQEEQNIDGLSESSSLHEQHQVLGQSPPLDRRSPQIESELQKAIAKMKPNERNSMARRLIERLKKRGFCDRDLERQFSISPQRASDMTIDSVTKLASFTYNKHPDIFQDVLTEQPTILKFLGNPLIGAIINTIAARWLGSRRF